MSARADVLVAARDLRVRLRRDSGRVRSLREYVIARIERRPHTVEWVDALAEVSFDVRAGELFAVVGANGAGKTTLLRALAGIVPPAGGAVRVHGRIAPLIELGAGFDPELTGEENVLLYGTLLGLRRAELRRKLADILTFAGTEPAAGAALKTYSSGMIARLGFAVATAWTPDVLAVDEVLAVGDEAFRARCAERIDELRARGTAVVLVTHDLALVEREADRALLLEHGRARALGDGREVVEAYRRRAAA